MQNKLKPGEVNFELQNFIDTFHESFIKRIVEEAEEYLFRQFERHGYSRDEVLSLVREGRITAYEGPEYTRYMLDGEALFEIILTEGVLDGCRYGRMYACYDLKEVKEG